MVAVGRRGHNVAATGVRRGRGSLLIVGNGLTRSISLVTATILAAAAVAVIVVALSREERPRAPPPEPDTVAHAQEIHPQPAPTPAETDPTADATWESAHQPISVPLETAAEPTGERIRVHAVRSNGSGDWSSGTLGACERWTADELRIRIGRSDGFTGAELEMHVRPRGSAPWTGEAAIFAFRDAGPPFLFGGRNLQGSLTLDRATWSSGDVLLGTCEVMAVFDGEAHRFRHALSIEVP